MARDYTFILTILLYGCGGGQGVLSSPEIINGTRPPVSSGESIPVSPVSPPLPSSNAISFEDAAAEIDDYVSEFEERYLVSVGFEVKLDSLNQYGGSATLGNTIGRCRIWIGNREVLINYNWWRWAADYDKKIVIYHELGHCHFNRGHDDSVMSGYEAWATAKGIPSGYRTPPKSMMHSYIHNISWVYRNSDDTYDWVEYYEEELKDPGTPAP